MKKNSLSKRQKTALFLIAVPIPLLILVISMYAVASFLAGIGIISVVEANLFSVLLGLFGVIAVLGILFGMPTGAVLLAMSFKTEKSQPKNRRSVRG